jgi:RNA polymerase sigma-70 factor (ECF subfamily)
MESPPDPGQLRSLLEAHHGASWRWALACCRRAGTAEDVLHEVYVKVLDGRATFEGRSSFRTWLFGVIRISALAQRRRSFFHQLIFEPLEANQHQVAAPASSDWRMPLRIQTALEQLSKRQREIVVLVFQQDLTVEEAAEVMGISLGTARQHYDRAKQKLRDLLQGVLTDE